VNKYPPPAPGTWRRDDGTGPFQPPVATDPAPIPAPVPSSEVSKSCPYCGTFVYLELEGTVGTVILDHIQAAHPAIWAKMQEDILVDTEKIEGEFV
jgi:hypothetical protein